VGRAKPELTVFPGKVVHDEETKVLEEVARLGGKLGGYVRTKRFPLRIGGEVIGKLIVGTSLARVERDVRQNLIVNLGILGGVLLMMVLYASFILRRLVVSPLNIVVKAMNAVRKGNLDQDVDIKSRDEIGVLANTYNFMVSGLREREHLKDAFNRYVSDKVYEKFREGSINLTGEARQATVLFSDIRSFTSLSERLTPEQVVAMLNEYFTEMVEIIFRNDGMVNKFIGDAIMAIYNVPLPQSYSELRAVRTAVEMVDALEKLNARREARGDFAINIGIGINTGPVVAGNIGHQRRLEYTVIGDTVNLAQRLESQTKVAGCKLLVSEATYQAVCQWVEAEMLPPVKVKGKAEPVNLYSVTAVRHDAPITAAIEVETPVEAG